MTSVSEDIAQVESSGASPRGGTALVDTVSSGILPGEVKGSNGATYLLAALGLVLIAIHLSLLYRIDSSGQLGISLLAWPAVVYLFHKHRQETWDHSVVGSTLGVLLLVVALSNSSWTGPKDRFFPYLYPLLAGAGFVLLARGFGGLRTHWREMTVLVCLGVPRLLLGEMEVLPPVTAQIAGFAIWYLGQEVEVVGTQLVLPEIGRAHV